MEPTIVFGALGAVFMVSTPVIWAVKTAYQTEGRVNTLKAIVDERDKKLDERLERIESKIDNYFNYGRQA